MRLGEPAVDRVQLLLILASDHCRLSERPRCDETPWTLVGRRQRKVQQVAEFPALFEGHQSSTNVEQVTVGGLVADLADAVQGVGGAGRENPGTFEGGNALDLSGSVEPGAAALNQLLGEYLTELPALDERTVRVGVDTGLGTRTVDGQQGLNRSEDTEVHRLLGGVDQSRIDSVHSAPKTCCVVPLRILDGSPTHPVAPGSTSSLTAC